MGLLYMNVHVSAGKRGMRKIFQYGDEGKSEKRFAEVNVEAAGYTFAVMEESWRDNPGKQLTVRVDSRSQRYIRSTHLLFSFCKSSRAILSEAIVIVSWFLRLSLSSSASLVSPPEFSFTAGGGRCVFGGARLSTLADSRTALS